MTAEQRRVDYVQMVRGDGTVLCCTVAIDGVNVSGVVDDGRHPLWAQTEIDAGRVLSRYESGNTRSLHTDFCFWCNVSLDLHDGHNSCETAKRKAAPSESPQ